MTKGSFGRAWGVDGARSPGVAVEFLDILGCWHLAYVRSTSTLSPSSTREMGFLKLYCPHSTSLVNIVYFSP